MKKIAVLLAGSGHKDGSEIHEAAYTILSLSQQKVEICFVAPNQKQFNVVNHINDEQLAEERNILTESARIARGQIKSIDAVEADDFDALIMPGGFGAAKNLCNFAFKGSQGKFLPEVENFVTDFNKQNKPIGAICIAPAIITLLFGKLGVNVTIGNDEGTANEIEKTGAKHVCKNVDEILVDEKLKIVTTPAFMYGNATFAEVFTGVNKLVKKVIELA